MRKPPKMSPPTVEYISTYTVRPQTSSHPENQIIHLTPWDLNLLPVQCIQKGLLFLKPENHLTKDDDHKLIDQLKTSFARTLDFFFPFAGSIAVQKYEDGATSFHINCIDSGAELVHASSSLAVSDILDPVYIPQVVYDLFPIKEAINHDGIHLPLLSIQVTFLTDGIFIGCTMNHTVCDGSSFWHFMNSWSEIATGSQEISRLPVFNRWFVNENDCPIRFPASIGDDQFIERYTPPPVAERMFNFSKEVIAKLKAKANNEMNTTKISSLQAVLAHVWIAVTSARKLGYDDEVSYGFMAGTRARVSPPLPDEYFGNAVQVVTAKAKAGELVEKGLGFAAWIMNQAIASLTVSTVTSSLEAWMKNPVLLSRRRMVGNFLFTGSSPRFNMYGNDFGWGKPIAVRSGCGNKADGKITVYPGGASGSMDIEACLLPETLKSMGDDPDFMEAFISFV